MFEQNCLWVLWLPPGTPVCRALSSLPPRHWGDIQQTSIQVLQWDMVHTEFMLGVGGCLCLSMQFLIFVKINSKSLAPWEVWPPWPCFVSGASGASSGLESLPQTPFLL